MWPSRALTCAPKSVYEQRFERWCDSSGFRCIRTQVAIDLLRRHRPRKADLKGLFKIWRRAQFFVPPIPPATWDRRRLGWFGDYYELPTDSGNVQILWEQTQNELADLLRPWQEYRRQILATQREYEQEWLEAKEQWRSMPISCRTIAKRLEGLVPRRRRERKPEFRRAQLQSFPDYTVFFGRGSSFLVEIKSVKGRLKPHQRTFYPRLVQLGFPILVGRPLESFVEGWQFWDTNGERFKPPFVPVGEFTFDD